MAEGPLYRELLLSCAPPSHEWLEKGQARYKMLGSSGFSGSGMFRRIARSQRVCEALAERNSDLMGELRAESQMLSLGFAGSDGLAGVDEAAYPAYGIMAVEGCPAHLPLVPAAATSCHKLQAALAERALTLPVARPLYFWMRHQLHEIRGRRAMAMANAMANVPFRSCPRGKAAPWSSASPRAEPKVSKAEGKGPGACGGTLHPSSIPRPQGCGKTTTMNILQELFCLEGLRCEARLSSASHAACLICRRCRLTTSTCLQVGRRWESAQSIV